MRNAYIRYYIQHSGSVKALIIMLRIRDGGRKRNMVEIVNVCTHVTTDMILALKAATGKETTKDAVNDAIEYRIKHGGKKA